MTFITKIMVYNFALYAVPSLSDAVCFFESLHQLLHDFWSGEQFRQLLSKQEDFTLILNPVKRRVVN